MARCPAAILALVVVASLVWEASSFVPRPQPLQKWCQIRSNSCRGLSMLSASGGKDFVSSLLPAEEIEKLWVDSRTLLRLGKKGFQPSHVNSLGELLKAHKTVRVKCNDASADLAAMAEAMMAPKEEEEEPLGVVLRVKGREVMVARRRVVEEMGAKA